MPLGNRDAVSPEIEVVHGTGAALRAAVLSLGSRRGQPIVVGASDPGSSWTGVRRILAQCRARLGSTAVEAALESQAPAAQLVLDHWRPDARAALDEGAAALSARIESHLTHNWVVQRPLFAAWARILGRLLGGRDMCLVIPCLNDVDWETLAALKSLFRLPRRCWPRLVAGHDDGGGLAPELDTDGIAWRVAPRYVRELTLGLLARAGTRCHDLGQAAPALASQPTDLSPELPADLAGCEAGARALLASGAPLDEGACAQVVDALQACFRRYGFRAALWLGRELLRRRPDLGGEPAVHTHEVVALSAHNRQFSSQGNTALGAFIARHLEAALALEQRPVVRCALLYRLAVAYGRRLSRIDEAERWATRAVEAAAEVETDGPRYQLAWAHNIKAYVHVRRSDAEGARSCMQTACTLVSARAWHTERANLRRASRANTQGDLALTRSLVLNNLAAAEASGGELRQAARTLDEACRLEAEIEGSAKYWAMSLLSSRLRDNRPDLALREARLGLRAAARDREASLRLYFLLQVAGLAGRLGDHDASASAYGTVQSLLAQLGPFASDYPDIALPAAAAYEAAGNSERATRLLRAKLETAPHSAELRAEVCARLALLAARQRAAEEAETWAERASDAAAEDGRRHCLVRTALLLARAARQLGRPAEARELARRAFELVETRHDPQSVAPADELLVRVELLRCGGLPPDQHERCLLLVPAALASASAWDALPDLLALWGAFESARRPVSHALAAAIRTLLAAAQARPDCRRLLRRMRPTAPRGAVHATL